MLYNRMMGADHPHVAMSMNNLANAYAALGDYRQASALHVEVLALYKRGWVLTTQTSPYTGMNNLVNAYAALSDYRQAAVLHVGGPGASQACDGCDHPDIAI